MRARFASFGLRLLWAASLVSLAGCANGPADELADWVLGNETEVAVIDGYPVPAPPEPADAMRSWGEVEIVRTGVPGPYGAADGPYLLDTGDRLRVFVYGQPNLSRAYAVDQEGCITVPLIGAVDVRGHTTAEVEGMIKARLGAAYVRDPVVTVDIQQNRPFFILGEVKAAGQYPYVSGMTVETAVAIAGGYSERASDRSFRVTRRVNGFVAQLEVPADFAIRPGDTVFVYERFL
jgi:polysaccharide export outer membrane protein